VALPSSRARQPRDPQIKNDCGFGDILKCNSSANFGEEILLCGIMYVWSTQGEMCRRILFFCVFAAWIGSSSEEPAAASARAGCAWGHILGAIVRRKHGQRIFCLGDRLRGGGSGDGASSTADEEDMLR
jgi:hypothetical protein